MTRIVIDASVSMSWGMPDEQNDYADRTLEIIKIHGIVIPPIWRIEMLNALLRNERKRRISPAAVDDFLISCEDLPIEIDGKSIEDAADEIHRLGRQYELSAYDAAYLELAIRRNLPLATSDDDLRIVCKKNGILFNPQKAFASD